MKKSLLLALTLLLAAGTVSAQEQKVEFSFKAGLNLAYEHNWSDLSGNKPGLYAGFATEFPLGNHGGIQPELIYSMQGAKDGGFTDNLDYINLPVIFKIYPGLVRRFSIDIGPQFGYMISAKVKYSVDRFTDIYDDIDNKFDFGVGVGFSLKIGRGNPFDFSVRGNLGLVNPVKDLYTYNGVIQIGFGARF